MLFRSACFVVILCRKCPGVVVEAGAPDYGVIAQGKVDNLLVADRDVCHWYGDPMPGDFRPGVAAQGYVTNVEGILRRIIQQVEMLRDSAEDDEDRKKAKNLLKKLQKIITSF